MKVNVSLLQSVLCVIVGVLFLTPTFAVPIGNMKNYYNKKGQIILVTGLKPRASTNELNIQQGNFIMIMVARDHTSVGAQGPSQLAIQKRNFESQVAIMAYDKSGKQLLKNPVVLGNGNTQGFFGKSFYLPIVKKVILTCQTVAKNPKTISCKDYYVSASISSEGGSF